MRRLPGRFSQNKTAIRNCGKEPPTEAAFDEAFVVFSRFKTQQRKLKPFLPATSLGMTGQPTLDLLLDALPIDALVHDIVYAPLETELLAQARARGNPIVDGLGMLLHQARPGFEAWFGVSPEVTPALRNFVLES